MHVQVQEWAGCVWAAAAAADVVVVVVVVVVVGDCDCAECSHSSSYFDGYSHSHSQCH